MSGELSAAPYHSPGREGGREGGSNVQCTYTVYTYTLYIHVHRYTAVVSLVSNTK